LMVRAHSKISNVTMMDLKGMYINVPVSYGISGENVKISTEELNPGMWILNVQLENGSVITRKIQK